MNNIINGLACCGIAISLVGCGSDSDDGSALAEFSLNDYEGRVVSTDTLSGTWVAVGTGTYSYTDPDYSDKEDLVLKEYFVITGDSDAGYTRANCESYGTESIIINANSIAFGNVTGTVADNKSMTAVSYYKDEFSDGSIESSTIDLSIIKISDATDSFGTVKANVAGFGPIDSDISCYQQVNGKGVARGESYTSNYVFTTPVELNKFVGAFDYTSLSSSLYSTYIYSDEAGESASFEVNATSALTESVTFSASNSTKSVTGTISVSLPVQ
jgi:hypothetical protein